MHWVQMSALLKYRQEIYRPDKTMLMTCQCMDVRDGTVRNRHWQAVCCELSQHDASMASIMEESATNSIGY